MFILLSKSFSDILHHDDDDREYPKSFSLIK